MLLQALPLDLHSSETKKTNINFDFIINLEQKYLLNTYFTNCI